MTELPSAPWQPAQAASLSGSLRVRGGNEKGGEQSPPPFDCKQHYFLL
jgi:hypothetical protein